MNNELEDELSELILFDSRTHDKTCGVTLTRDLGNCDCNKTELKQKLAKLISKREIEARLDELRDVQLQHGHYMTQTFVDGKAVTIEDRIAQLTELQEGKEL